MASCFMCGTGMKQNTENEGGSKVKIFSYREMRNATHDFSGANKIGEGGFGSVFRGKLKDGTIVAVKVLSVSSRQGIREFVTELTAISDIVHENLITLVGCCAEGSHRILVYNYLENNSLSYTLIGSGQSNIRFNWRARVKIADLTPKISDFGLARLLPPNATHVSTKVAGTIGYLALEYAVRGQVTKKSDIYSFGVVLLEIVTGRCNHNSRLPHGDQFLLERTWTYYEQRKLEEIIDAEVGEDLNVEEACRFLKVGLLCTQDAMKLRPNMANIVLMLTGEKEVSMDRVTKPAVIGDPYLNGNNDQRPSNADSTTLRSFATTEPLTSSEANTEWSL
ncbi:unnamed protein product [Miscanthus lutarioriparius]|uniref:Protein kinase domain-containing protein n=1 Tax=Miscanthus lutarioriparius TaxID=422564 RepID=A0A811PTV4_9POAL|nr:unnamed protein product [Miscanthus lutarioriparius]